MCCCLTCVPYWGPGPQPRPVPSLEPKRRHFGSQAGAQSLSPPAGAPLAFSNGNPRLSSVRGSRRRWTCREFYFLMYYFLCFPSFRKGKCVAFIVKKCFSVKL